MARPLSNSARAKALAAAQEVIAEFGVDGFTVDAVAKASGVAKTTIYRHWESGNALLFDSIDCMITPFPTPNTGSLADDLQAFMEAVLPIVSDHTMQQTMMGIVSKASTDPEFSALHQSMILERMTPIRTMLELARARGEIDPDLDLTLAMDLVEGPFFFRKMVRREPITETDLRQLLRLITRALETGPDEPPSSTPPG